MYGTGSLAVAKSTMALARWFRSVGSSRFFALPDRIRLYYTPAGHPARTPADGRRGRPSGVGRATAPPDSAHPAKCRPIGCYEAAKHLAEQYRRDR